MVQVNLYQYMFPKTNENISQTNLTTLVKATQKKIIMTSREHYHGEQVQIAHCIPHSIK